MVVLSDSDSAKKHARAEQQDDVDVIVVGSAMVGGTLALALGQQGYKVLVVDARNVNAFKISNADIDKRTTALASSSALILGAFGIWPHVEQYCCRIDTVHVSQQGHFGVLRMTASEFDVPAVGYVLDNAQYLYALRAMLDEQDNVSIEAPAEIVQFSQDKDYVQIKLSQKPKSAKRETRRYRARLLVAADGAGSVMRERVGIGSKQTDYQQHAIIANVETELHHQHTAYERFTATGPLAMLPVSDHVCSAVYTIDSTQLPTWLEPQQLRDGQGLIKAKDQLCAEIQEQFGDRFGELRNCSTPTVYPLLLSSAEKPFDGRTLLLGNALRALHPVAGQGFNLALRDIGKLIELLSQQNAKSDPGTPSVLSTFTRARSADQTITVGATDLLARVFRGENRPFSKLRALGLIGINGLPPLKRMFALRAMGYGPALPDLNYHRK